MEVQATAEKAAMDAMEAQATAEAAQAAAVAAREADAETLATAVAERDAAKDAAGGSPWLLLRRPRQPRWQPKPGAMRPWPTRLPL